MSKGLRNGPSNVTLPKVPSLPAGTPKGGQNLNHGYSMKHRLRKGTEFQGMDTIDSGLSDQMTDYARMTAAGGGK